MKKIKPGAFIAFFILPFALYAQTTGSRNVSITLPKVLLLDVEPTGNINFAFIAPTEAGNQVTSPALNNTKWLQYTSAKASADAFRRVTAAINQASPNFDIKLQVAAASGQGGGVRGTPVATQITLSTLAQTIITGIGGAFTGTGANNGHQLTYTVTPNNYANLVATSSTPITIVVTYTIVE